MTNPTQIITPGGTRLTVPLAWTCWTFKGHTYSRAADGTIRRVRGMTWRWGWTGKRWEPVPAPARFLEVV